MMEGAGHPVRVLLIEDEPADARLVTIGIKKAGGAGFSVVHAGTLAEAAALFPAGADVVLLDLSLPDSFGLDTLAAVTQMAPPNCPVLVLTGHDDHHAALTAVEAGAQDYLVKGQADGAQVCRAIQHAIRRKQLEERLRLSEERFKAIFTLAQDPIIAADTDMNLVLFNRAAEETFGWKAEEVIGKSLGLLVPERYRAKFRAEFVNFMNGPEAFGRGQRLGLWAVRRNGEEFAADASLSHVAVPEGLILAATVRDVSQQRAAQASLERQAAEMAALAERLDAALAIAEQASQAKSEFLAMMSHEVRTPLNGILGMTRLLLDQQMPAEQRERLEIVNDSGEALLAILNDILDFSKLEAGRFELEAADFDMLRVVRSTVALMESRAQLKGVSLAVEMSPEVPRVVNGDPNRLRQILLNLVGNAVKFTADGEVNVSVSLTPGADGDMLLLFAVKDSGIGIDEAAQKRLFQDFTQADASVARRFGGTGLGLAICKRLVALMGGEIGVESKAGAGSRFWFTLPLRTAESEELVAPCAPAPVRLPASPRSLEVLLAEDNPVNQMVVCGFLQERGHRVLSVENGLEAVEAMRSGVFDVVLMDMQMPVMDGVDAARFIRSLPPPACDTPIIALTANAGAEDARRCHEAGMDGFVRKPIAPEELFAALATPRVRRRAAFGGEAAPLQLTATVEPAVSRAAPTFDNAIFDELGAAMGADVLAQLVRQLFGDAPLRVEKAVAACRNGDLATGRAQAHDIKSMAATFGLIALSRVAEEVERACRDGESELARRQAEALPSLLEEALSAMDAP